ncbi:MAG: heme exporter protein CcmB [Thermoguttaceae bacterium]
MSRPWPAKRALRHAGNAQPEQEHDVVAKLWWIFAKDLVSEWRARRVWPAMLLLGVVAAVVFTMQIDLAGPQKLRAVGGLLWLAVFFAGMSALERSFACEREGGCWEGLLLYPVSPAAIYLAKLAVNVLALAAVQVVLFPLFSVLSDVPLLVHPWPMLLVALLGNLGLASVGTLVSALAAGIRHSAGLAVLVVLPLVVPVVLGAAEATRLVVQGQLGPEGWRWLQFLITFDVIFITAGTVLFDFVVEE